MKEYLLIGCAQLYVGDIEIIFESVAASKTSIKHENEDLVAHENEVVHEEDQNSLPSDSEKFEETSHEYEEFFIENTEDNFETHATLEMKQRASTDGCLNYEGVPTDGCSHLYVGDIETTFESVVPNQTFIKHKNEGLVVVEQETITTSPSPLEIHEVGPSKKEEYEEVHL